MPLSVKKITTYTLKDYYDLPDDVRAELIGGRIYYMSSPSQIHQEILGELLRLIGNYISEKGGPCKVIAAPFDVKLYDDKDDIVQPDISIICDIEKLDGRRCNGAPDWIIEIASPSNATHDYVTKMRLYEKSGVRNYWIVNPEEKTIVVFDYQSDGEVISEYSFEDSVAAGIYDDLVIDFAAVAESMAL